MNERHCRDSGRLVKTRVDCQATSLKQQLFKWLTSDPLLTNHSLRVLWMYYSSALGLVLFFCSAYVHKAVISKLESRPKGASHTCWGHETSLSGDERGETSAARRLVKFWNMWFIYAPRLWSCTTATLNVKYFQNFFVLSITPSWNYVLKTPLI